MKFKINRKYQLVQTAEMILGFVIGLLLVYKLTTLEDFSSSACTYGIAAFVMYWLFVVRMRITVTDYRIVYKKINYLYEEAIFLKDITKIKNKKCSGKGSTITLAYKISKKIGSDQDFELHVERNSDGSSSVWYRII